MPCIRYFCVPRTVPRRRPPTSLSTMTANDAGPESVFTVPLFIGGSDCRPDTSFDVVSPQNGSVVHRCGSASIAEADAAVSAAAEALKTWRTTTPIQRREIFLKASEILLRRREELRGYMVKETGASIPWCEFNLNTTADMLKDIAGRIPTLEGSCPALADSDTSAIVLREPYGVVLAVAPWYVHLVRIPSSDARAAL